MGPPSAHIAAQRDLNAAAAQDDELCLCRAIERAYQAGLEPRDVQAATTKLRGLRATREIHELLQAPIVPHDALEKALKVARETGVPGEVVHMAETQLQRLKTQRMLEEARESGDIALLQELLAQAKRLAGNSAEGARLEMAQAKLSRVLCEKELANAEASGNQERLGEAIQAAEANNVAESHIAAARARLEALVRREAREPSSWHSVGEQAGEQPLPEQASGESPETQLHAPLCVRARPVPRPPVSGAGGQGLAAQASHAGGLRPVGRVGHPPLLRPRTPQPGEARAVRPVQPAPQVASPAAIPASRPQAPPGAAKGAAPPGLPRRPLPPPLHAAPRKRPTPPPLEARPNKRAVVAVAKQPLPPQSTLSSSASGPAQASCELEERRKHWSMCLLEEVLLRITKQYASASEDYACAQRAKQREGLVKNKLAAAERRFLDALQEHSAAEVAKLHEREREDLERQKALAAQREDFELAAALKRRQAELAKRTAHTREYLEYLRAQQKMALEEGDAEFGARLAEKANAMAAQLADQHAASAGISAADVAQESRVAASEALALLTNVGFETLLLACDPEVTACATQAGSGIWPCVTSELMKLAGGPQGKPLDSGAQLELVEID
mmetsp:Transcript_39335/g.113842  ORF Transcript_39335/g.113842 Transcript_39335/m.113842 type:complete len:619 (-) Transcript_39335:74-1930(-)